MMVLCTSSGTSTVKLEYSIQLLGVGARRDTIFIYSVGFVYIVNVSKYILENIPCLSSKGCKVGWQGVFKLSQGQIFVIPPPVSYN